MTTEIDDLVREELARLAAAIETPGEALSRAAIRHRARVRRRRRRRAELTAVVCVLVVATSAIAFVRRDTAQHVSTSTQQLVKGTTAGPTSGPTPAQLAGGTWTVAPRSPLPVSYDPAATWTGREVLVWGGPVAGTARTELDVGAAYDPTTGAWRMLPQAPGGPRVSPIAATTGTEWLLVGGMNGGEHRADGIAYEFATDTWTSLPDAPFPPSSGTWTGSQLVVVNERGDRIAVFDPADRTWHLLPDPPSSDREEVSGIVVWDGTELLLRRLEWVDEPFSSGDYSGTFSSPRTLGYRLVSDHWEPFGSQNDVILFDPILTPIGVFALRGATCPRGGSCPGPAPIPVALRFDGSSWLTNAPPAGVTGLSNTIAWTGRSLIIGGCCLVQVDNTTSDPGVAWDPETDDWQQLPAAPNQIASAFMWTGTSLFAIGPNGDLDELVPAGG